MKYYKIKNRYIRITLFSGEYESLKECVEDAVRSGINLHRANLEEANLEGANLHRANLKGANLKGANLKGANLKGANLKGANLKGACLYRANLKNTLLWNTTGNGKEIKNIEGLDPYKVVYTSEVLQIGCENHPIKDWWGFSDERIIEMDGDEALRFWRENKEKIMRVVGMTSIMGNNDNIRDTVINELFKQRSLLVRTENQVKEIKVQIKNLNSQLSEIESNQLCIFGGNDDIKM